MTMQKHCPGTPCHCLSEPGGVRIQVKSEKNQIELISPTEFHKRFGVAYTPSLILAEDVIRSDGQGFSEQWWLQQARAQKAVQALARRNNLHDNRALEEWLAEKVRCSYTSDVYVSKISDLVGYGLFAGAEIEIGDLIGEYTGFARHRNDRDRAGDNHYLYYYSFTGDHVIDAENQGNCTRFINHSKRHANIDIVYAFVYGEWHILLLAMQCIQEGQQLLLEYGPNYLSNPKLPSPIELQ